MPVLALLLLASPLVSAVLITLLAGRLADRKPIIARVSVGCALLTSLAAKGMLAMRVLNQEAQTVDAGLGDLYLDPLAGVMVVVVAAISLVVHIYSVRYMAEEAGYARFFALLDLMTFTILLMVTAGDLITLLLAWHLVGVLLYFLLGHDLQRAEPQRYALRALITYRLGDLPLVLAALLLYDAYATLSLPDLFARVAAAPLQPTVFDLPIAPTVALLVALAAFARSAQVPLHIWLPYTMEGPTPVSALMHAGIVNAGGYLLNRFAPVYVHAGEVLHLVFAVGLITAILGSMLMLTQNDVKKALGYSTMGQMGFMFVEVGVGAFSLAIYHLIAHGLFKGTLFLGAGGVIGEARRADGVPHDEVYAFVVQKRPAASRLPWLLAAGITVVVPLLLLGLTRWLLGGGFVGEQGAIILLFFGWVTGAQLLFATHRLEAENPWRVMGLNILSLAVVVAGYTFMEHAFGYFLYPDRDLAEALYAAASIPAPVFYGLVAVVTLLIVLGWIGTFYGMASRGARTEETSRLRLGVYSLVSREFYVADLHDWLTRSLLAVSRRLNLWSRWI